MPAATILVTGSSALCSARSEDGMADLARLLEERRSVGALRLGAPGPSPHELRRMLTIASRVPDHGALAPWRFVLVDGEARERLSQRLADACLAASVSSAGEGASDEQALRTVQKLKTLFVHPPLIVVVVSRPDHASRIRVWEQALSAGAACMNLITAATAFGYGANWLTGWTATHPAAHAVLGLGEGETVAGIIPIGTAMERPPERPRPNLDSVVTAWPG
jgi:nitroreductase